jgi:hypothetical protein
MIAEHGFSGDCCTLQSTGDGGCVLIVINGKCTVRKIVMGMGRLLSKVNFTHLHFAIFTLNEFIGTRNYLEPGI